MSNSISIPAMTLYGIQRVGPSSFNDETNSGADFSSEIWHAFIDRLIELQVPFGGDLYGVSWPADEHVPPQHVNYFCGLESATPIEGLEALQVEGGNYFEYRCEVPATNLDAGFREAYMTAMPASGLTPRQGQHLEVYGEEYDPNAEIAKFRILIPVV